MASKRQKTIKDKKSTLKSQWTSTANTDRVMQFANPLEQRQYDMLKNYEICSNWFLDKETISKIGLTETIEGYLANIGWKRFADIQFPAYREPTLEFLSTLKGKSGESLSEPGTMSFGINGKQFSMSVDEFNIAMGFEDEESIRSDKYRDASTDLPSCFKVQDFSAQITNGKDKYCASKSKATQIHLASLRLMQKFIAHGISARKESTGAVSKHDLFYLWCMSTGNRVNLGAMFLLHVLKLVNPKCVSTKSYISVGSYISHMAFKLGALQANPHAAVPMIPISLKTLVSMIIVKEISPGSWELCNLGIRHKESSSPLFEDPNTANDLDVEGTPMSPQHDIADLTQRLDRLEAIQTSLHSEISQLCTSMDQQQTQVMQYLHRCFKAAGFSPPSPGR